MLKDKYIAIISTNTLTCIGLKSILCEYFNCDHISIVQNQEEFKQLENENKSDLIFIPPDIYVLNETYQGMKSRIVIMVESNDKPLVNQNSLTFLDVSLNQTEIIDNLNQIFRIKIRTKRTDLHEDISIRESEVLKLVSLGLMNKQIADMLSISLHTVISHRKNLTRKLGINTVSGLTIYSLINGLITTDDLTNVPAQPQDF